MVMRIEQKRGWEAEQLGRFRGKAGRHSSSEDSEGRLRGRAARRLQTNGWKAEQLCACPSSAMVFSSMPGMLPAPLGSAAAAPPRKRPCEPWASEPTSVLDIQSPASDPMPAPPLARVEKRSDGLEVEEDGILACCTDMDEDGSSSTITDMMMSVLHPQHQAWHDELPPASSNGFPAGIADKGVDDLDTVFLASLPHLPPDQSLMRLLLGEVEDPLLLPPQQRLNESAMSVGSGRMEQQQNQFGLQAAVESQIIQGFSDSCFQNPSFHDFSPANPTFSPHPFTFHAVNPPAILNFCDQPPQLVISADACLLPLCYQPNYDGNFQPGFPSLDRTAFAPHNLSPGSVFPSRYNLSEAFSLGQNGIPYMDQNFQPQAVPPSLSFSYMPPGSCLQPEPLQQQNRFHDSQNGYLVHKNPWQLKTEPGREASVDKGAAEDSCARVKQKPISAEDAWISSLTGRDYELPATQWVEKGKVDGGETQFTVVNHLLKAAEAVGLGNIAMAQAILARLNQHLFSQGKPLQRAAYHFKDALAKLVAESEGSFSPLPNNDNCTEIHILNKISAYTSFCELSALPQFGYFTANQAILEAMEGEACIHLIDFELGLGGQWASFLQEIASRPGHPAKVKITALGSESIEMDLIRMNLYEFARSVKIPFELQVIPFEKLGNATASMFGVGEQEAIAVNIAFSLKHILEEFCSIDSITAFLRLLKDLSPKVVTVVDMESQGEGFSFFNQFVDSLKFYASLFESLEVTTDLPMEMILKIEKYVFAPRIIHLLERKRDVKLPHWGTLLKRVGFFPHPLSSAAEVQANCLLQNQNARMKGFHVVKDEGRLHLEWQGRILVSASTWNC